ncbi:MAG: gliding motility-associated C-terminal domain-containing protein, partial [Cytophagaceae bacterium]
KIKNASHPFVQFDGSVLDAQGTFKSMTITSGIFLPNTYAVIQDNSGPGANYKAIVRKYGLTLTGGNVFYFAGQPASYDWSSNAGRNAYRMILNAIMMPAAGSQVCSAADIEIKASLNKPEFCLKDTMSLLLIARNMGKKQATNVSIKNSVPSGLITIGYSSTHGTYSPSGKTWTIPVIQPGISDTLMIHYFLPVTGLISSSLFSVGNLLDLNRLNDTARVSFQVNPLPVINAGLDTALCLGSQLRLGTDSIAGNLYSWTSGSGTFNSTLPRPLVKPLVSTTFLLHKKTIASGCQTSDSVRVHINPVPVFDLGQDRNLCAGDTLRISLPDGAGMVSGWNSMPPGLNGSSGTLITVPSVSSTLYLTKTLTATGCHTTDSILISLSEPPSISVAGADSGTYHANASLTANVPVTGTGTWMILEGGGNIENIHAPHTRVNQMPSGRNVFVWMISNGACKASADEVVIQVKDLNIPQGFSPNGDGVNEAFEVEGILEFPESRIEIFNRWGIMVFSKDRYDNSWRGENHHGEKLPDDTYYYVISIDDRKYKSYLVLKR